MRHISLLTILCWTAIAFPIGYQHGIFRSQSTQGESWTGTAFIQEESFRITVQRNYLDVEMEWTMGVGGNRPSAYEDALEIVGNINLERGSVVIGMLVWYKDMVLKAKLKKDSIARFEYEEVVDRNTKVPPPPRDPVILEARGRDNYDISVFPVKWGGTRRLRIRYLVPMHSNQAGYPHAFTANATATIIKGADIPTVALRTRSGKTITIEGDSAVFDGEQLVAYSSSGSIRSLALEQPASASSSRSVIGVGSLSPLPIGGEYAVVSDFAVSSILDSARAVISQFSDSGPDASLSIYAIVSDGTASCSTGVQGVGFDLLDDIESIRWHRDLAIHSSKPLIPEIMWRIYGDEELLFEHTELPYIRLLKDGAIEARVFAAANRLISLDRRLPRSLPAALGYVDTAFALLALEDDALPEYLEARYEPLGVPAVYAEDIFAESTDMHTIRAERAFEPNDHYRPVGILDAPNAPSFPGALLDAIRIEVLEGQVLLHLNGMQLAAYPDIEIALYDPRGRLMKRWSAGKIHSVRTLHWSTRNAGGNAILVVSAGLLRQSKPLILL